MTHFDRRSFLITTAGAALATALPAQAQSPEVAAASQALTVFLDAAYEQELQLDPESLTYQGRKDQLGKLTDRSEAAALRQLVWRRKSVADMKARFKPDRLSEEARTSFEMWALELQSAEARYAWRRHGYAFARGGVHTGLPNFLINFHGVDTKSDMEAYIARIGQVSTALDQTLAQARDSAARGIRMPRWEYDRALSEVARVTAGAPFTEGKDCALLADVRRKTEALRADGKISSAEADALTKAATTAMIARMKPGYDRVARWLTEDRANTSADAKGAGSLPDGANYYNAMLFLQTTTDMTAEQIHSLGLSEVARLRKEMETVKAQVGFTGSLEEFFQFMRTDRQFYLPDTDAGREEYLRRADSYLSALKKKLPQYFGTLPKADLVVKRVEAFREEAGGAQHYFPGTPDGSRPGIFYAHLSDMNAMPAYQLENIAYHEGLPGHHMQIAIAQELTGLPKFRTQYRYTAYTEGWGLYSEALAHEMGFTSEPYNNFGRLSGEIWRAIRLVVDTGLHAKGWSESQAVAYFTANSSNAEAAIRSEIQRYIVNPGQATCYKIGMLRLQALRDEARTSLGDRFDYRNFHDVVLKGGSLPLPVLEARVRRWIATSKA